MQFNVSETGRFLHYKVTLKSVLFKKGTGKQSCYMRQILCFFFFLLFYYFPPTWLASGHPIQSDATLTIKTTAIQLISSQASPKQQQHNASRHYKVPYTLFLWQIQTSSLFFFFQVPTFPARRGNATALHFAQRWWWELWQIPKLAFNWNSQGCAYAAAF